MNTILTKDELDKIKYSIENDSEIKPQYWLKLGYRSNSPPREYVALRDLVRWSIGVAKKFDVHVKPWPGIETSPDIRLHIHVIMSANKELPLEFIREWHRRHGDVWCDIYDPSKHAVHYQWFKHQYEEVQVICPRKKSSCRRKRCRYLLHNL